MNANLEKYLVFTYLHTYNLLITKIQLGKGLGFVSLKGNFSSQHYKGLCISISKGTQK